MQLKSVIERALELADSGEFATVTAIKLKLAREGYGGLGPLLSGKAMRDQLKAHIKAARLRAAAPVAPTS